jgi:AcrR family transcriptional regulator
MPSAEGARRFRRTGRPARIDRQAIARAAAQVGARDLTMKAVAERLGVSVPSLYHHVSGRSELVRLAAEYSVSRIRVPVDRDQPWSEWLLEWAEYARASFVAQPELLGQFLHGSISIERMFLHVDAAVGLLTRQGFTPAEALDAYHLVGATALGFALSELRDHETHGRGSPVAEYHRVLAEAGPGELQNLRRLAAESDYRLPPFEWGIRTVVAGIAAGRASAPGRASAGGGDPRG